MKNRVTYTLSPSQTVDPFAKVVVCRESDGSLGVRAYILVEQAIEGARTGIAIDGSGTMMPWFGAQRRGAPNIVSPFVQRMCTYLAEKVDATGCTTVVYWATGDDGRAIEPVGTLSTMEIASTTFAGPRHYGNHTFLLPVIRYFIQHFMGASWSLGIFITDGRIDDLEDVKAYTTHLAHQIAAGQRSALKFVLVGVGHRIDETQMAVLDNLETGTDVDLWDYKIAKDMQHLAEIFAEVVSESVIIAPRGVIRDTSGEVVVDYRDTGVPALLAFTLPAGATAFSLEVAGQSVTQPVVDIGMT
ncbi:MAG: hypothetical protein JXA33_23880 [Anaerolineae bacterium]|nr:hypothetical protein [Anaerolineae bacterium]